MVVPYKVENPVRSYVFVPNSGWGENPKITLCDLSRVANIPPSAPLPKGINNGTTTKRKAEDDLKDTSLKKPKVEQLTELCKKLEEDNKELKKKLVMFQKIFKDRSKLNEVLKRLDAPNQKVK